MSDKKSDRAIISIQDVEIAKVFDAALEAALEAAGHGSDWLDHCDAEQALERAGDGSCLLLVGDEALGRIMPENGIAGCFYIAVGEKTAGAGDVFSPPYEFARLNAYFSGFFSGLRCPGNGIQYENLVQALPDIIYVLDGEGRFTFVNEAVRILGYEPEDLFGKHFSCILYDSDAQDMDRERILSVYNNRHTGSTMSPKLFNERRGIERKTENLELRLKSNPSGSEAGRDLLGTVISYGEVSSVGTSQPGSNGNESRASVGIVRDITLRRKSEEMLRKLYQAVDQLSSCVFIVDHEFRIEYVNPAFFQLSEFKPQDLIGRHFFDFLTIDSLREAEIIASLRGGFDLKDEVSVPRSRGGAFWASLSMTPVRAPSGQITHAVAIFEDSTRRRSMEEMLRRARDEAELASKAKSAFLANVSHELRSPINATISAAQLTLESPQNAARHMQTIIEQANTLLGRLGGILDYVRSESGKIELQSVPFMVEPFIRETCEPFRDLARRKGLSFEVNVHDGGFAETDPERLGRIMGVLLDNAVKYTESGFVKVTTSLEKRSGNVPHLLVDVVDSGSGLSAEEVSAIFEPFTRLGPAFSRRKGGIGIGLALARNLTKALGGELRVSGGAGSGSTFSVLVPIGLPSEVPGNPEPGAARRSLLIVDDNEINLEYMRTLVEQAGHSVCTANDGAAVLLELERNLVDVVLLDIQMPGMSGIDVARRIRASSTGLYSPDIPLIALTAYDATELGSETRDFHAVFTKPVDIPRLLESVNEAIGSYDAMKRGSSGVNSSLSEEALGTACSSGDHALETMALWLDGSAASLDEVRSEAGLLAQILHTSGFDGLSALTRQFAAFLPQGDTARLQLRFARISSAWRSLSRPS